MTFPSAAVCESSVSETRWALGGNSAPTAPTWVVDHAAERLSVVFNQPPPMPNGRRKTD